MFKKLEVSFPYHLEYPIKVVVRKIGILGFFGWIFQKFGRRLIKSDNILISERIVELPSVYLFLASNLLQGGKILEIGHVNSSLALELASLGFQVTAIDIRDYPFSHPNLTSLKGDFLNHSFNEKFDWVISVSTIEHFGYNKRYGGQEEGELDLDDAAFSRIRTLLKPDGKFILTVPYAVRFRTDTWFKTYTRDSVEFLLRKYFHIDSRKYYVRKDTHWLEAKDKIDDPLLPYDGVGIFLLSIKT